MWTVFVWRTLYFFLGGGIKSLLPSASTSLIISWSSASVGFWPRDRITVPSSLEHMVPSPSLSKRLKASLNSESNCVQLLKLFFLNCSDRSYKNTTILKETKAIFFNKGFSHFAVRLNWYFFLYSVVLFY